MDPVTCGLESGMLAYVPYAVLELSGLELGLIRANLVVAGPKQQILAWVAIMVLSGIRARVAPEDCVVVGGSV